MAARWSNEVDRLVDNARELLPNLTTTVLTGASHHSLPTEDPHQLNLELSQYFT
jgi:hypothetical protein